MGDTTIYLANKNYSSWSLRGWLALRITEQPFEDVVIPLDQADTRETILRYSPSGRLPALHHGNRVVWDSLAIGEYLAAQVPEAGLLPEDTDARANCRSIIAEMHAGFSALRQSMPMNVRTSYPGRGMTDETQANINRITAIWRDTRRRFAGDGPFLFGPNLTLADAAFAPVVSRFRTYGVRLDEANQAYCDAIWSHSFMAEWRAAAADEPMIIDQYEF